MMPVASKRDLLQPYFLRSGRDLAPVSPRTGILLMYNLRDKCYFLRTPTAAACACRSIALRIHGTASKVFAAEHRSNSIVVYNENLEIGAKYLDKERP